MVLQNPVHGVRRLAEFMGIDVNDDLVNDIVQATRFNSMRVGKKNSETSLREGYGRADATLYRKGSF